MHSNDEEDDGKWGSRKLYLMAMMCQTIGTTTFVAMPHIAISFGACGYIIGYALAYLFIGVPLLYMEFVVSQFTARGCVDVWKARACLSHVGYVQLLWQLFLVFYNHTITVFVLHYFLISFEDPIPYFVCGPWATKLCNVAKYNYSVNKDCIQMKEQLPHCEDLFRTYPEYQYWRYYILGEKEKYYYVAWRVCLASAVACVLIFLSCFKRKRSVKWFIYFFTLYPTLGYVLLMIGSMTQKGVVVMFEEALDTNFNIFVKQFKISKIIQQVVYTLNIGTGISFNMGSSTSFRTPCYSNIVITVVVCTTLTVVAVCTISMMACPYAYQYDCRPTPVLNSHMSTIFEKTPRLLKEYEDRSLWLILIFSCNAILALSTNVVIILSCLEMMAVKFPFVEKYSGLCTFAVAFLIFLITTPLLGNIGVYTILDFRWYSQFITIFIGMMESLVFVVWYGLDKFSEDVHFMQGVQPKMFMKLSWVCSGVILAYVFCNELYFNPSPAKVSLGTSFGWWSLVFFTSLIVIMAVVKIVYGACKHKFPDMVQLNTMWGPRTAVLLRSRAMFSAQAMTKEYMYRQYHLQAGILARQRASNVRRDL